MTERVGQCGYCGCTDEERCRLHTGEECGWQTAKADVCTRPACLAAERRRLQRVRDERRTNREQKVRPVRESFERTNRSRMLKRRGMRGRAA